MKTYIITTGEYEDNYIFAVLQGTTEISLYDLYQQFKEEHEIPYHEMNTPKQAKKVLLDTYGDDSIVHAFVMWLKNKYNFVEIEIDEICV